MKFQRLWPEILALFPNKNTIIITNKLTKNSSGLNKVGVCPCFFFSSHILKIRGALAVTVVFCFQAGQLFTVPQIVWSAYFSVSSVARITTGVPVITVMFWADKMQNSLKTKVPFKFVSSPQLAFRKGQEVHLLFWTTYHVTAYNTSEISCFYKNIGHTENLGTLRTKSATDFIEKVHKIDLIFNSEGKKQTVT